MMKVPLCTRSQSSLLERRTALEFTVQSPWRYGAVHLRGYHASAEGGAIVDYGPFATVLVEGGAIPVGTARACG